MKPSDSKRPIKVCFVSPKAYPLFDPDTEGTIGGAEVDLYMLSTELAKDHRFEASCITADYGQPTEQFIENVRVIKSLDFKQNPLTGAIKIWKAFIKADADIYFLESISLGIILVKTFSLIYKRALVYRTASQLESNGYYLKNILGKIIYSFLRKADAVVVQNRSDKDAIMSTAKIKSIIISNGQRLPEIPSLEKTTFLWVGRSALVKRPELFLDIAKQYEAEFVMICQKATGDENYDQLINQAKKIHNLKFIEKVPFDQIDSFFAKSRVLINTSDSEGFPNTFIQAAKYGTPILSLNVNPDGFLDKYDCGICCNGNFVHLLEHLELFSSSKALELGLNARRYVESKHDISVIIDDYKQIFRVLFLTERT